jgi:large subunit ribosomal protein L9
MEVILTQNIENLGTRGQVVRVADGYARNFLLPRKLALPATKGHLKTAAQLRAAEARREEQRRREAERFAARLREISVTIPVRVGESGRLYGSVTAQDIAQAYLEQHGIEIDRRHIHIPESIRSLGTQFVRLHLHNDVNAELMVNVVEAPAHKAETGTPGSPAKAGSPAPAEGSA